LLSIESIIGLGRIKQSGLGVCHETLLLFTSLLSISSIDCIYIGLSSQYISFKHKPYFKFTAKKDFLLGVNYQHTVTIKRTHSNIHVH